MKKDSSKKQKTNISKPNFEPPFKEGYEKRELLPPPTGMRLMFKDIPYQILNGNKGKLMPFFTDDNIECNDIYKYTLIAYDKYYNYSYPIESIIQHPCNVKYDGDCQFTETGIQPYVESYQNYENDASLIHILSEYYKEYDNKEGLSELTKISRKNES